MGATVGIAMPMNHKHLLGIEHDPCSKRARVGPASDLNRGTVLDFTPPLLMEVVSFLSDSHKDTVRFCNMVSSFLAVQFQPFGRLLWSAIYSRKWPALFESMAYRGVENWQALYIETYLGTTECILEVFGREKKPGFAMAAMAAYIHYDRELDAYIANYISASDVLPEAIPVLEAHRLRFCPDSARGRLLSDDLPPGCSAVTSATYPYKVLEDVNDLVVGQGVELQWKMQLRSPFGWWFGTLESLRKEPEGKLYIAIITFRHFASTSRWYRLVVHFGDSVVRPCTFGGYTGGIRGVEKQEQARWMAFLPNNLADR